MVKKLMNSAAWATTIVIIMTTHARLVIPDGSTKLHAVVKGDAPLAHVEKIIEEQPDLLNRVDIQLRTALHWAALYGRNDIVDALLAQNAHVNVQDYEGNTPLHLVSMYTTRPLQRRQIIEYLIDAGGSIDIRNDDKLSVIDVAIGARPYDFRNRLLNYSVRWY